MEEVRTTHHQRCPVIFTFIENGWLRELSHAAYLGRELAKAAFSLKYGSKYIQDKALGKAEKNTE